MYNMPTIKFEVSKSSCIEDGLAVPCFYVEILSPVSEFITHRELSDWMGQDLYKEITGYYKDIPFSRRYFDKDKAMKTRAISNTVVFYKRKHFSYGDDDANWLKIATFRVNDDSDNPHCRFKPKEWEDFISFIRESRELWNKLGSEYENSLNEASKWESDNIPTQIEL